MNDECLSPDMRFCNVYSYISLLPVGFWDKCKITFFDAMGPQN